MPGQHINNTAKIFVMNKHTFLKNATIIAVIVILAGMLRPPVCKAQNSVTKRIIIDTVTIDGAIQNKDEYEFDLLQQSVSSKVTFENNYLSSMYFPAFNCLVSFVPNDDLSINVTLDNNEGELELHHLEKMGDTVHISCYRIYNNCLFDSITYSAGYFHHLNDTSIALYKQSAFTSLPKGNCTDTLKSVHLDINGKIFTIPVSATKILGIKDYHGYPKKIDEKRLDEYVSGKKKALRRKVKYNTFWGRERSYKYAYSGRLDFQ